MRCWWLAVPLLALSCRSSVGPRGPSAGVTLFVNWTNPSPGVFLACGDDLSSPRQHWVKGTGAGPWTLPTDIPVGAGTVDCYAAGQDGPVLRWEIFTTGYECTAGGRLEAKVRLERTPAGPVAFDAVFSGDGCSVAPSGGPGPKVVSRTDPPPRICCGEKVKGAAAD